jgi:3-deoxy-manno-octulosonate cytidylyltransferase (CMP-KDO synthetase)
MLNVQDDDVVVNIQGDEPLLIPDMLSELLQPFADSATQVSTLAKRISAAEAQNPNRVKVVTDNHGQALYFSRSPIPFDRKGSKPDYKGHIGIYAFRMNALRHFQKLGPSLLETLEYLEQLRLLENGISIQVVMTHHDCQGVDTPADLELVLEKLSKDNLHEN